MNTENPIVELTISNTGPFRGNIYAPDGETLKEPKKIRILQARLQYIAPNFTLPSNLQIGIKRVNDKYYEQFGEPPHYGIILADAIKNNLQIITVNGTKLSNLACAFKTGIEVDYPREGETNTIIVEFQK